MASRVLWPHNANNGGAREDNEASGRSTGARTARAGLGSASTSAGTEGRWAPHRGYRGGHGEGSAGCNALYFGVVFFFFLLTKFRRYSLFSSRFAPSSQF